MEFVANLPTVGSWSFKPEVRSMQVRPGKLYEAKFQAGNLTGQATWAQAVPDVSPSIVGRDTVCYDMTYGKADTPFVTWAQQRGCEHAYKGWGMLVEQAAESFDLWRCVRPETAPVLAVLALCAGDLRWRLIAEFVSSSNSIFVFVVIPVGRGELAPSNLVFRRMVEK